MKKYILPCLLLLLPFALLAQDEPTLYKDFYNGIKAATSLVLNDHVNIMQVNTDNENFDVVAVDDQMRVLWKTPCEGFAFKLVKFKNNVVAIASTDHSMMKGSNNTYKAYLIDPASGKVLVEKVIYSGSDDYMEFPTVLTGEGAYLKFCIRQSGFERKVHVGLPSFLGILSLNKYAREMNETHELNVITLNEKLETVNSFKPPVAEGTMIAWCGNKQSDLFIAWLNGPSIEVYKYVAGNNNPVKQLNADVELKEDKSVVMEDKLQLLPSSTNNNILYYGLTYSNQDRDAELGIGKFDFSTGKKSFVTEAFDKSHVKALQKGFVPVNKKLDDADLGTRDDLRLRYMTEANGSIVAALTSRSTSQGMYGQWLTESGVLINIYDTDLNTKFQQILPVIYTVPVVSIPFGYHIDKDKLFVVGNNKSGMTTLNGVYGCLDLATGKWEKMNVLSKKKIDNSDHLMGDAILWFGNSYVVPYFSGKGLTQSKFDVTLQQNDY